MKPLNKTSDQLVLDFINEKTQTQNWNFLK